MGPLKGLRVLDLSTVLMGPYASQLMADLGADVIKVEPPEGDIVRQIGQGRSPGMSGIFLGTNRGKRSVVLDLKTAQGHADLLAIARSCDIFLYNMRPQAMARLRLSYEDIARVQPAVIYAGVYGYGEDGPYAGKPAYDDLIQGMSGIAALFQEAGGEAPRYVPLAIADRMVGVHAVSCMLAALHHRDRTGEGQRIDIPMFETMASMVLGDHLAGQHFEPPLDGGGYARLLSADRAPLRTRDGYICVLLYTDRHWRKFFAALGRDDAETDPRYRDPGTRTAHIRDIYRELTAVFATKTTGEWMELLGAADIPAMPLQDRRSLMTDPHLAATGFFQVLDHPSEGRIRSLRVPSQWSRSRPEVPGPAPRLGQHTEEVLREAAELAAARAPAGSAAGGKEPGS